MLHCLSLLILFMYRLLPCPITFLSTWPLSLFFFSLKGLSSFLPLTFIQAVSYASMVLPSLSKTCLLLCDIPPSQWDLWWPPGLLVLSFIALCIICNCHISYVAVQCLNPQEYCKFHRAREKSCLFCWLLYLCAWKHASTMKRHECECSRPGQVC